MLYFFNFVFNLVVENYVVIVYMGNIYMVGMVVRVFVELFGELGNLGEVELVVNRDVFYRGR